MIENTEYGNMFINDGTGTLYIYGTLDADGKEKNFLSLGIGVGDKISIKGPRSVYNDVPQLSKITVIDIQKSAIRSEVEEYVIEKDASDKIEIELIGTGFDSYFFGQYADKEEDRVEAGWVKFLGMTMSDDKCKVKLHVDANDVEGFRSTSLRFTAGESIAEITLTQKGIIPEAVTTTEELVADDYVKISGTVYAVSAKGILVKDNTGYVLCTDENYDAGAGLGEIVEVVGKVGSEDNCTVIVADQIERKEVDKKYEAETATELTANTDASTLEYLACVKLTGAVDKDGKVTLNGYGYVAYEPAGLDPASLKEGTVAVMTGYVMSVDESAKEVSLLLTSLEEQKEDAAE